MIRSRSNCLCHIIIHTDVHPEAEVIDTTDPGPILHSVLGNTEQVENFDVADHTTSIDDSDEVDEEGDSDEDFEEEDDSDEDDHYEDDTDKDDGRDGSEDSLDSNHCAKTPREFRAAQRGTETIDPRRYEKLSGKRKRVVCSESRSPSTERLSAEQPGFKAIASTHASNTPVAHPDRRAASTSMPSANVVPGARTLPYPQNTPQPTPVDSTPLTPASEASTSNALHDSHRERALAKRQLELSKAKNRAAELEAHNRINEIQQEIEFETRFGDVPGE